MTPTDILIVWVLGILIFVLLDFLYRMSLSPSIHPIIPEPWDTSGLSATEMYEAITDEESEEELTPTLYWNETNDCFRKLRIIDLAEYAFSGPSKQERKDMIYALEQAMDGSTCNRKGCRYCWTASE